MSTSTLAQRTTAHYRAAKEAGDHDSASQFLALLRQLAEGRIAQMRAGPR